MKDHSSYRFCDIIVQLNTVLSRGNLPPELYRLAHYIMMNCCICFKTGRMQASDKQLSEGTGRRINTIAAQVKALGKLEFFNIKRGAGPAKTQYTITPSVWLEAAKMREEIDQRYDARSGRRDRQTEGSPLNRHGDNYPTDGAIPYKNNKKQKIIATRSQAADVTLVFSLISPTQRQTATDLYDSFDFERSDIQLLVPPHGGCWVPTDLRSHYSRYIEDDVKKLHKSSLEKISALKAQTV